MAVFQGGEVAIETLLFILRQCRGKVAMRYDGFTYYKDICRHCAEKAFLEHIGTFGASAYRIADLQLFRDADAAPLATALAHCAIVRLAPGDALAEKTARSWATSIASYR